MEYIKEFAGAKFNFLVTSSPEWKQQNYSIIVVLSVDFLTGFMTKMMRTSTLLDAVQLKIKFMFFCETALHFKLSLISIF